MRTWFIVEYRDDTAVAQYEVVTPEGYEKDGYRVVNILGHLDHTKSWYERFFLKGKTCPRRFCVYNKSEWELRLKEQKRFEEKGAHWPDVYSKIEQSETLCSFRAIPAFKYSDLQSFLTAIRYKPKTLPWQSLPELPTL